MAPFMLIGAVGGLVGAVINKGIIRVAKLRKTTFMKRYPVGHPSCYAFPKYDCDSGEAHRAASECENCLPVKNFPDQVARECESLVSFFF